MSEFTENLVLTEESIVERKMITLSECFVKQLCCKQDIVAILTLEDEEGYIKKSGDLPIEVISVWDGHGHNIVTETIREFNLYEHFNKINPAESMQKTIDEQIIIKKESIEKIKYVTGTSYKKYLKTKITEQNISSSGSTLSFAKIYRNIETKQMTIIAEWLGDSPIIVFINNELVFVSEIHNAFNEKEIERLKTKKVLSGIEDSIYGFKLIDEERIINRPSKYILFNTGNQLACTRSLGHNRITGIETQKHIIECSTDDEVKILIFSDGVGDMLLMDIDIEKLKIYSAEELVNLAEKRWKQTWFYGKTGDIKTSFELNGYDDCSCVVWCQKKQ
jgi:serine/threonine protein phosphatase PrpC